ncbi:MAG: hypothetical protein B2I17_04615 [Thermoplasmatales archaeon B_DKE]|nr:MAG: hypothetical protein B2I17_04615 [Thermoplasmatales archaeon B_DKE]
MDKRQRGDSGWLSISIAELNTISLIYETGNFGRVAEIMGINTSLVSYRVNKLEKNLGFKIFERDGKTISNPTKLGYKFIQSSQDILAIILRNFSDAIVSSSTNLYTGEVAALTFLPRLIQRYEVKFNKRIRLQVYNNLAVLDSVIKRRASLGIVSFINFKEIKGYIPLLSQEKIFSDEIIIICPKEWKDEIKGPISVENLSNLIKTKPFIGRTYGSGIEALMEQWFRRNDLVFPKQEFSFSNSSSVISAVSRGMGFSMVFKTQVLPLLDAGMVLGFSLDPMFKRNFHLIMLKNSVDQETLKVAKFLERGMLEDT